METTTMRVGDREFTLRMYEHPGKYEGELRIAEFLDNPDFFAETSGAVDEGGHYGLIRGAFSDADLKDADLTEAERDYLKEFAGAIVRTDSLGFVHVDYFDDSTDRDLEWVTRMAEFDLYEEDEEEL